MKKGMEFTEGHTWDLPHIETDAPPSGSHGVNYCSRAAISMFASYYGTHLSQDRIAFEDWDLSSGVYIDKDLRDSMGHGRSNDTDMSDLLSMFNISLHSPPSNASWENITTWIDKKKPMIAWVLKYGRELEWTGHHFSVIDGYREKYNDEGILEYQLHVLDPWVGEGLWLLHSEYHNVYKLFMLGIPKKMPQIFLGMRIGIMMENGTQ